MKKTLVAMLILMLALGLTWAATAEERVTIEDYEVEPAEGGGWLIVRYVGTERDLVIPGELDGQPVVGLGNRAFAKSSLTSVQLPEGLTTVGGNAFTDCVNLREIIWPSTLVEIKAGALMGCEGLTTLELPEGLETLGNDAFANCVNLERVTISGSGLTVGNRAFMGCVKLSEAVIRPGVQKLGEEVFGGCAALTRIEIPASVMELDGAFLHCERLTELVIAEDHPFLYVSGNLLLDRLGKLVMRMPGSTMTRLRVPDDVTAIADYAFCGCASLIRAEIPDQVTSVGYGVFAECPKLEYVGFPSAMTELPGAMFRNCTMLANVTLPSGLTSIGNEAFAGCTALKRITFPDTLTYIGENAFYRTGLTKVTFPALTGCDLGTFHNCKALTEVRVAEGSTGLPYAGFIGCDRLRDVYIPASATYMGTEGFDDLSKVTFHVVPGSEAESYMIEHELNYKTDYPVSQ